MKFNAALNNFTSGEWSPKMVARADAEQYPRACKTLKNAMPQLYGGAFKRPGFHQAVLNDPGIDYQDILDNSTGHRIIPWTVQGTQYLLFTNTEAPNSGTNTWFLIEEATNTISTISAGPHSDVADPDNALLQYYQIGDTLFMVSPGRFPCFIRFESSTAVLRNYWEYWAYGGNDISNGIPFEPLNADNTNGTITATGTFTVGGTITLQSSVGLEPFEESMEDWEYSGVFQFVDGASVGYAVVDTFTDTNTVTATVMTAIPGSSPATFGSASGTAWARSAWSADRGWPTAITGYEQRLYFGRGADFWGSRIGNVFDLFNNGIDSSFVDDNSTAWSGTLANAGNNIRAMTSAKMLVFNLDSAETVAYGTNGALGKLDVKFESSTSFGSEPVLPIRVNNFLTFVQAGGRKLRDLVFSFDEYQYKSNDLSFTSDHLTLGDTITEIVRFERDCSYVFARTKKGKLLSLTLDREYQVNAWAQHQLGGFYMYDPDILGVDPYPVDPQVIALASCQASVPTQTSGVVIKDDVLYALVRRTIGTTDTVRLERLCRFYEPDEELLLSPLQPEHPFYLDSACSFVNVSTPAVHEIDRWVLYGGTETATTAWTGLTRYAGATVSAFADGIYIGEITISGSGTVTLDEPAAWLYLGYKYTMELWPMPLEVGSQIGSSQGLMKRAHEVFVRLYNTVGLKYGVPLGDETPEKLHDVEFRRPIDPLDEPVPLFTGDKRLGLPGGSRETLDVYLESDYPYPCNVLAMVYTGITYD